MRNTVPALRQPRAGRGLRLGERGREVGGDAHHLAGRAHLRAEQRVGAGEAVERQHRLLDRRRGRRADRRAGRASASFSPSITRQASLASGMPGRLGDERHRARRARVGLDHVEVVAEHAVLDVDQPDHAERERERRASPARISSSISRAERVRRQHAGRVAGVDAGLLDVLHDRRRSRRPRRRRSRRRRPRSRSRGSGRGRSRAPCAPRATRAGSPRARRASRRSPSPGRRARSSGARAAGSRRRGAAASASSARVRGRVRRRLAARAARAARRSGRGPRRGRSPRAACRAAARPPPRARRRACSGVWPPNCTITPSGCSTSTIAEHVLERQRLEVQPVGGVVVGRDRLRVAVDHHRVAAGLAHGHRRVHAAVVELDALADPVRAGAEDHHARLVAAADLARPARAPRPSSSTASRPRTRRRRCRPP